MTNLSEITVQLEYERFDKDTGEAVFSASGGLNVNPTTFRVSVEKLVGWEKERCERRFKEEFA